MNMKRSAGFSIMEIMVVLFIIGLILSMVGPRIVKLMSGGNETATKATLSSLKNAAVEYQMDIGSLPRTLEHLVKNVDNNPKWRGPYLEGQTEVPADKWGNAIVYNVPPKVFSDKYKSFELYSFGEKGEGSEQSEYLTQGS